MRTPSPPVGLLLTVLATLLLTMSLPTDAHAQDYTRGFVELSVYSAMTTVGGIYLMQAYPDHFTTTSAKILSLPFLPLTTTFEHLSKEQASFVRANAQQLQQEVALGAGQTLDLVLSMYAVPEARRPGLRAALRGRYRDLCALLRAPMHPAFIERFDQAMRDVIASLA